MTQSNKTNTSKDVIKSVAWLIEATFRGFVGYELLNHFHSYVIVAAAVYSLATSVLIVVVHFVKAHKA